MLQILINESCQISYQILNPIPGVTDENRTSIPALELNSLNKEEDIYEEKVDGVHFIGNCFYIVFLKIADWND